jgi:hypothetical protein
MNCDDELRIVKRDDNPHTKVADITGVARVPAIVGVDEDG